MNRSDFLDEDDFLNRIRENLVDCLVEMILQRQWWEGLDEIKLAIFTFKFYFLTRLNVVK